MDLPALLTTTSIGPWFSVRPFASAATAVRSVRSAGYAAARPPPALIDAARAAACPQNGRPATGCPGRPELARGGLAESVGGAGHQHGLAGHRGARPIGFDTRVGLAVCRQPWLPGSLDCLTRRTNRSIAPHQPNAAATVRGGDRAHGPAQPAQRVRTVPSVSLRRRRRFQPAPAHCPTIGPIGQSGDRVTQPLFYLFKSVFRLG